MTPQQRIAELMAEAIARFEGMVVTWNHAKIYADAIKQVEGADPEQVEWALKSLRKMVTEK